MDVGLDVVLLGDWDCDWVDMGVATVADEVGRGVEMEEGEGVGSGVGLGEGEL